MKKIIVALALVVTAASSFGQGYFLFKTSTRVVWDTVGNTYIPDAGLNTAFLFGSGTPAISALASYSTTNGTTTISSFATAWSDILTNSGGYTLAQNAGNSTVAVVQTSSVGAAVYNGGNTFGVTGTTAGNTYSVYVIAWSDAYATPSAAAAAGAAVGWSAPITYTSGATSIATVNNFSQDSLTQFGLAVGAVPEPGTIALAGMGIASLLAFRRRNSK